MNVVTCITRHFVKMHNYWIGLGVGMMCANPQPKYFFVGGAWAVFGLVLSGFHQEYCHEHRAMDD